MEGRSEGAGSAGGVWYDGAVFTLPGTCVARSTDESVGGGGRGLGRGASMETYRISFQHCEKCRKASMIAINTIDRLRPLHERGIS